MYICGQNSIWGIESKNAHGQFSRCSLYMKIEADGDTSQRFVHLNFRIFRIWL